MRPLRKDHIVSTVFIDMSDDPEANKLVEQIEKRVKRERMKKYAIIAGSSVIVIASAAAVAIRTSKKNHDHEIQTED
jgi:hypothetical protein